MNSNTHTRGDDDDDEYVYGDGDDDDDDDDDDGDGDDDDDDGDGDDDDDLLVADDGIDTDSTGNRAGVQILASPAKAGLWHVSTLGLRCTRWALDPCAVRVGSVVGHLFSTELSITKQEQMTTFFVLIG